MAGNNDYGTLLNFSLVNKRIKEEFKPVFYETLPYPNMPEVPLEHMLKVWAQNPEAYKQPPKHHERYKFTKYVPRPYLDS